MARTSSGLRVCAHTKCSMAVCTVRPPRKASRQCLNSPSACSMSAAFSIFSTSRTSPLLRMRGFI